DSDALALAAGQLHAALAHERFVTSRKYLDEFGRVRQFGGPADLLICSVRPADANVIGNRAMEHRWVLRYIRNGGPQRRLRDLVDALPAHGDLAALYVDKTEQQAGDCRFASAGKANQAHFRAMRNFE